MTRRGFHNHGRSIDRKPFMDGTGGFADIHCHCLPGIDDGPATMTEAVTLCKALVSDGIAAVMATPHQRGVYCQCNDSARIIQTTKELNDRLATCGIELQVLCGADIRVDERTLELVDDESILTLGNNGKYILLELPDAVYIDVEQLLFELSCRNIRPIISHPERNCVLSREKELLSDWIDKSAILQVTAGSTIGRFGRAAKKAAMDLLADGLASLVATDAHNINDRRPQMTEAFRYISRELGLSLARQVCIENPWRVIKSEELKNTLAEHAGKCCHERV